MAPPSLTATVPSAPAKLEPINRQILCKTADKPAERSTPVPPLQDTERADPKFVRANSVALETSPNAKANILDRLNMASE